jgi:Spy/CpxP family protein refolding chaperone
MKKITILFLCLLSFGIYAQHRNGRNERRGEGKQERIQTAKIGLLTQKMNLTTEQAPQFWAIYNEYDQKRMDIQQNIKKAVEEANASTTPDDKILALNKQITNNRRKMLDLEEDYTNKFLKVISVRQYAELQKTENHFKRMLLERVNKGEGKPRDDR